jgi:hypothetical protein
MAEHPDGRPFRSLGKVRLVVLGAIALLSAALVAAPPLAAAAPRPGISGPCAAAPELALDAPTAPALSAAPDSAAWLAFRIAQGQRYTLAASGAALQATIHDSCADGAPTAEVPAAGLAFTALRDGTLYLAVRRDGATAAPAAAASAPQIRLSEAPPPPGATAQTVPPEALRRAAEFLEEWRGSPQAPEWAAAQLSRQVRTLFRPDLKGPAYYEFKVVRLDPLKQTPLPAGFIELSAGQHDYPVSRWDFAGLTPSEQAQQFVPDGSTILQYYKLDTLAYVIEYEPVIITGALTAGTTIANLGDLPSKIVGLDALSPQAATSLDEGLDSTGAEQRVDPQRLPNLKLEPWGSWDELKAGYAATYRPLLAALQDRAAPAWKDEISRATIGETLVKGDVRTVYGLPTQTISAFQVTGTGAGPSFVRQDQLQSGSQTTGLRLTVVGEPADRTTLLDVNVLVQYTSGFSETLKYKIANSAALSIYRVYLPLARAEGGAAPAAAGDATLSDDWGPWRYWWADGDANAIRYGQFDYSGCKSGCGGTSWAMAFAWVDRRAAENHPVWRNHWGLYREGGGLGANAVAPLGQDAGVQSMTTQIRNAIGTFCAFGSGATFPWRMIDAANYVRPRATAAWSMRTRYDPTGLCVLGSCDGSRDLARDQIINRRAPAVVGTGWLSHYPLAFGYAERSKRSCFLFICNTSYSRWFYVNNGWYGANNGWTSADVWFGGVYRP